ncbi:MAG TPA: hypothetical protein VM684_06140, partial [Gaiellales bacterium]|nr:hypothetical protein [Gaiellales bacterium]
MTPAEDTERPPVARGRAAVIAGRTLTVLALGIVWCALVAPNQPDLLTPGAFLRIPIEGVVLVTLSLVLPGRWARVMAVVAGGVLGVLTVVKILDIGFFATLDRPFDPVTDWGYFGPATGVVRDSVGHGWTVVVVIGAVLIGLAVLGIVPLAMLRVTRVAGRHPAGAARTVAVLATAWVLGAALGLQFQAGEPIASTASAGLAYDEVQLVRTSIDDQASFDRDLRGVDRFGSLPGSELLTGLRGKDVVVAFVESYGRVAVQDSTIAPAVDAVLRSGTASLQRHGYLSRSAFLTSPTFGGISWLAHSTLQSGLWVDNQNRYDQLVASDRFTLSDAFARAGWRTVGDVPSNSGDWPEGRTFYH